MKGFFMRRLFVAIIILIAFGGCSNTWHGVKEDAGNAVDWSKEKINRGAGWVKEKTE